MAPSQLTLNFVARQTVWALEHQAPALFAPKAAADLGKLLQLDFSPASITRIQDWLNKQRVLRSKIQRPAFAPDQDGEKLTLLSFYVAEWVARSTGGVPNWTSLSPDNPLGQHLQAASVVNFPEDAHASLGMLNLMGVMQQTWETEGADLLASLLPLINAKVLDLPDQALPVAAPDRDRKPRQRIASLNQAQQAALLNEPPTELVQAEMRPYFFEQRTLLAQGHFTCGGVIQADNALLQPIYTGLHLAEVVYDPASLLTYEDITAIARSLATLKALADDPQLPAELRDIAHYLKAENVRRVSADLPLQLFGYPLKISSLWVEQAHLPNGMLSDIGVPLLIAPGHSQHIKLLPHASWSEAFVERWMAASEARLGERHRIADLLEAARVSHRQALAGLLVSEADAGLASPPAATSAHPATPSHTSNARADQTRAGRPGADPANGTDRINSGRNAGRDSSSQRPAPVIHDAADDDAPRSGISLKFTLIGLAVMVICMLLITAMGSK